MARRGREVAWKIGDWEIFAICKVYDTPVFVFDTIGSLKVGHIKVQSSGILRLG
jgi:hypothetical protein